VAALEGGGDSLRAMAQQPISPIVHAPATVAYEQRADGSFLVAENLAHEFMERGVPEFLGVLWQSTNSYVLDRCVGGRDAHITVKPPASLSVGHDRKRTKRRPHDRKQLTEMGQTALSRMQRISIKGQLWRGSIAWRLQYRCARYPLPPSSIHPSLSPPEIY